MRTIAAALVAALATAARADEGMWMPQQIPALAPRLRALGWRGDPKVFSDLTGAPMGAIVSLGGCSASFVSPDGLVATNHHCAVGALQFGSTTERNLLEDGFVARSRPEELPNGPGARVLVTVAITDVTDAITGRIDPALPDLARGELLERRQKARLAACERTGLRCSVLPFFDGLRWYELAQLELKDVRLVFAPPRRVGAFGGETDNWAWPRHAGDFALFRAYVGKDGKPAPYAKGNVPYRPGHWLRVSPAGVSEDDLVLVAGYPGRTQRLATYAETRAELEVSYPRTVRRNREMLGILEGLAKSSRETAIRVTPRIRQLANVLKNREGVIEGARRGGLLERRRADEAGLRAWIAADPARAEYAAALDDLDRLTAEQDRTRERDAAFAAIYAASPLLGAARQIVRLGDERARDDSDRDLEFQARNWPRIREAQVRLERTLDLGADRALLRYAALEAAALAPGQRLAPLDAAIGLAPGDASADAARKVDAWLDTLFAGTRLQDRALRLALLDAKPAEVAWTADTFLALARALDPLDRALRVEARARAGARSRLAPLRARALLARAGGLLPPDANGTLRVTFGTVKGVAARDGLVYLPRTRLAGVLEKDRPGDEDFDVPQPLREAIRAGAGAGGPFADARLGDVPVDFLATVDTTGGNSGSAGLDAQGRLVGLLFDGTYETVSSDFLFDAERTRSILVDVRYLLWYLAEVAKARHLLDELGVGTRTAGR